MSDHDRIYQEDPFCRRFTAVVCSCQAERGGWQVVLDRTAFFPEGGGQPCDLGLLFVTEQGPAMAVRVLDVQEQGGVVLHTTDGPLPAGAEVTGTLDWERRRDAMEQHTGEHILSGTLHRLFGAENVGFHIGPDQVRMDMSVALTEAQLDRAEAEANAVIRQDLPVEVLYPTPEELGRMTYRSKKELTGQVRIVQIPQADVCACCGTHLLRTGQAGLIKILSHQNYKGGTRLMVASGQRAFAALAREHAVLEGLCQSLSARTETAAQALERLLAENAQLKADRVRAENHWFAALAQTALPGRPFAALAEEALPGDSLRRLCLACAERAQALTALFCPDGAGGLRYALTLPGGDVRPVCQALNRAFGGRGGGKPALCQGSVQAPYADLCRFVTGPEDAPQAP